MPILIKTTLTALLLVGVNILTVCQPLASGQWSQFSVTADGICKIDYALLKKSGFNPDQINPQNLHIFGNGSGMLPQANAAPRQNQLKEIAIFIQGEADGKFDQGDFILFFAQGPDEYHFDLASKSFEYSNNLFTDKNFYFLTVNATPGKRLSKSDNQSGTFPVINQFNDVGYYETDQYNILNSGREWYGEQFVNSSSISILFNFTDVVDNTPITFSSHVMAQSYDNATSFQVFFNNKQILEQDIPTIDNTQYGIKGAEKIDTIVINSTQVSAASQTAQTIKYSYIGSSSSSTGYLNYFIFSLLRKISFHNSQLLFTAAESLSNPLSTFTIDNLPATALIWDVTNPFEIKNQGYVPSTGQASFSVTTDTLKKFLAFTTDEALTPVFESAVLNQNLSAISSVDLLIITHPDFMTDATRLADFRQNQNNLTTQVIPIQNIYNEYSGGKQDFTAIRDFVKDVYNRSGGKLSNLLLFGRCSYDYKDRVLDNTDFVPTYESRNSLDPLQTYSSDDYFGFLELSEGNWSEDPAENGTLDIGVGRISVTTPAQAKAVVDKLIDYETNTKRFDTWRKNIVFVADDGDLNIHQSQADNLATTIDTAHAEFTTKKIYVDQYKQITGPSGQFSPDTKDAIQRALEIGSFIVNYTGHGSETVWMQEQVLDQKLVQGLQNAPRYPLFVTATCEFGRHDDPFQISSGELLQLQPNGGGIGLVTTARPVNSSTNFQLNQAFYAALFAKSNGAYRDIGAIFRDTKNNSQSGVSNRNFSLLGDPSMHLAFANDAVALTSVKTISNSDTLKALSTVLIQGEVQSNGTKVTSFNGNAVITVFDRQTPFLTLGDENPPFSYNQWTSALFRGSVPVTNGSFQAQFIVPQNIETTIGSGKISTYACSTNQDASGASKTLIGGVEDILPTEGEGPIMKLFIGDSTFINGGAASPNTTLLVKLHAKNGVNLSEFGGHDNISAVLDDSLTYDLNSYYKATSGDSVGEAQFPLFSLQKGQHEITTQAFDTFGNKVTGTVNFVVTDGNLVVSSFYNYPNPFSMSDPTTLGFSHNRPGEDLDVDLYVYDLAGQNVLLAHFSVPVSLTQVILGTWDGTTSTGNKLGSGLYLGKVSVRSLSDGSKNQQFTKLIIVN